MRTQAAPAAEAEDVGRSSPKEAGGRRRGLVRAAVLGAAVGLAVALVATSLPRSTVARLHGTPAWAPGRRPAPDFSLRDQTGRLVSLAGQRGRVVLLGFMDSQCTKACPGEGRLLALAERSLSPSQRAVLMVVTVNPTDNARTARHFAAKARFAGLTSWHWLLGSRAALAPVWLRYAIAVRPTPKDIEHTTAVYLIDQHGAERAVYGMPFPPALIAADIRALEREGHLVWRWPWS